jgi:16S rRNA processing protein RimM
VQHRVTDNGGPALSLWAAVESSHIPSDAIEVGKVADAWGVQGFIKVFPYSNDPQALLASRRWYVAPADTPPKSFTAQGLIRLKEVKRHGSFIVAKIHGVDDRDIAASYKGARLFLPRTSFPTPNADEYYWVDLVGLSVVNLQDEVLGQVTDLMANGPQSVLVIQDHTGTPPVERLIPFVAVFVLDVNLTDKVIRVDWQADY